MVHERSALNLGLLLLAIGLVGGSFLLPWWEYDHSTGRRTPETQFNDSGTGVVRTHWEASPGAGAGTQEPEDAAATQASLDRVQWTLVGALALMLVAAVSELPGPDRILVRRVTLLCNILAFLALTWALIDAWFLLPSAFGNGAGQAFTSDIDQDGYTITAIRLGWGLAALALAPLFGGWLAKYQAGAPDPTVVAELYAQGEI